MPASTLVREVMTTDVLTFSADMPVQDAMRALVERDVDGAPVVDDDDRVVGMVSTDDLIVQETRLHYPTVISLFGSYLELPSSVRRFEDELHKAVAATVGEVMTDRPVTIGEDDTLEEAATVMHERRVSRLPVLRAGRLVGIVSRGDILRAIVRAGGAGPG
ncbi:MAG TPA: CBS domain-containing protein [Acidimicrobiales bacterium]|jgi:CBS domain-containing protein